MTLTFSEIEMRFAAKTRLLNQRIGEARALAAQGQAAQDEAEKARAVMHACEEASAFLNSFSDAQQEAVRTQVEGLVTHALQTVFDDEELTFHVLSKQTASRTEVSFAIRSVMDGQVFETSILDARGGGVAAVVGFLLRLVILLLRDDTRKFLPLDETFAQLSVGYETRLAQFLREIVDKTGVQILLVTHSDAYTEFADFAYRVSLHSGVSKVEALDAVSGP